MQTVNLSAFVVNGRSVSLFPHWVQFVKILITIIYLLSVFLTQKLFQITNNSVYLILTPKPKFLQEKIIRLICWSIIKAHILKLNNLRNEKAGRKIFLRTRFIKYRVRYNWSWLGFS